VPFADILNVVCYLLEVTAEDLASGSRHPRIVAARRYITRLSREFTTLSYPEIASRIGRPNHSTVITQYQKLADQMHDLLKFGGHGNSTNAMMLAKLRAMLGMPEAKPTDRERP
jgi:chromosomal replication initiation ATPase DnaA